MADELLRECGGGEPRGTYQVWHREDHGYRHVANADVGNLLAALVLPGMPPGTSGREAVTQLVEGARAATFGDVIVSPSGTAYRIDDGRYGPVFQVVDFTELRTVQALFAEQREDFQMGQEEAARGDFAAGIRAFTELLANEPEAVPQREKDREIER